MLVRASSTPLNLLTRSSAFMPWGSAPAPAEPAPEPPCSITRFQMTLPPAVPIAAAFWPRNSSSPWVNWLSKIASPEMSSCLPIQSAIRPGSSIFCPNGSRYMLACFSAAQTATSPVLARPVLSPFIIPKSPISSSWPTVAHTFSDGALSGPAPA